MTNITDVQKQARSLPVETRQQILLDFPEVQLHVMLKEMFKSMQPDYTVEITHGAGELGKDLVLVKRDNITTDVLAVVVKKGDISGRTRGDVDEVVDNVKGILSSQGEKRIREIESQIHMALVHPAEIPTTFARLVANKVSVVLAGTLSATARMRLEKEIPSGSVIYDISKLVDLFTEYYPQVFFDGTAIDFIQHKTQQLETKNWLIKSHKNLSEYFVAPEISPVEDLDIQDGDDDHYLVNRVTFPFSKLRTLTAMRKKIILVGDPGTGKSAALAKLSIDLLKTAFEQASKAQPAKKPVQIPIAITARELLEFDSAEQVFSQNCNKSEISHRFKAQTLLVDGLDEIAPSSRQAIIDKASKFSDDLNCSVVITSRKVDIINVTPHGFEKFELRPFQLKQALKLFSNLLQDKKHIDVLKEGLEKIRYQIPITPLSLVLLMDLVAENGEIPSSVTELYDRFVDFILGREDKKKGIAAIYDYIIKKKFLGKLAFAEFLQKDRLEVPREDFDIFFTAYSKEFGFKAELHNQFLSEIERGGVIKIGGKTIAFVHRSFLDYFTAFYIYDNRDELDNVAELIVDLWYSGLWQEVAFFFVGLKRDIGSNILNRLLEKPSDNPYTDIAKFMVGRLLQAGWHSPSVIKSEGISRAFSLAPVVKQHILTDTEEVRHDFPKILADFFVFRFANVSYRSTFLKEELLSY